MSSVREIKHIGLGQFFREPDDEYCHAAVRNRLLVAISRAEIEGYSATHEALIQLLRELEANKALTNSEASV